jgi:hypothetical protein
MPKRIHRLSDDPQARIQRRNHQSVGKAATVAGGVDPGFHTWPTGHIPQNTDTNPLIRSRFPAKKTFGETFGAATGVSAPSYRNGGFADGTDFAGPGFGRRSRVTWGGTKRCIRLFMTGARATSGGAGPRGADWGDRVGGLRGVACGHSRAADEDVGVPGQRIPSVGGNRYQTLKSISAGPSKIPSICKWRTPRKRIAEMPPFRHPSRTFFMPRRPVARSFG